MCGELLLPLTVYTCQAITDGCIIYVFFPHYILGHQFERPHWMCEKVAPPHNSCRLWDSPALCIHLRAVSLQHPCLQLWTWFCLMCETRFSSCQPETHRLHMFSLVTPQKLKECFVLKSATFKHNFTEGFYYRCFLQLS